MSLRKKPYLPLYVKDWLSNFKLKKCTAEAHGLMINIMCIMHLSEEYGYILLDILPKDLPQQKAKQINLFAKDILPHVPFTLEVVERALENLVAKSVLYIDDNKLICKRMVNDNKISELRSDAGSKGAEKTHKKETTFAKAKPLAKPKAKQLANSAIAINNENVIENKIKEVVEFFNLTKGGRPIKSDGNNTKFIRSVLEKDYTVEDCKHVIKVKFKEWNGGRMMKYFRLSTLFIPLHFEEYLTQVDTEATTPTTGKQVTGKQEHDKYD